MRILLNWMRWVGGRWGLVGGQTWNKNSARIPYRLKQPFPSAALSLSLSFALSGYTSPTFIFPGCHKFTQAFYVKLLKLRLAIQFGSLVNHLLNCFLIEKIGGWEVDILKWKSSITFHFVWANKFVNKYSLFMGREALLESNFWNFVHTIMIFPIMTNL